MLSRSAAILLVAFTVIGASPAIARAQTAPAPGPSAESQRVLQSLEDAFAAVADRVMPSVVNVSVKAPKGGAAEAPSDPPEAEERFREFFGREFFERFFRRRTPRDEGRAAGSGVIVDARGHQAHLSHPDQELCRAEQAKEDPQDLRKPPAS